MLKEIAKTGKAKLLETYLKKGVEVGAPLGQISYGTPAPDIPNFQIRLADSSVTGQGYRSIVSETDRINFCRFLERHGYLDKNILAKARQLEQTWRLQRQKIKEQKEVKRKEFMRKRKETFWEEKIQWESRHVYKDVYDRIKNLSAEQRSKLKAQVLKGEVPARFTHEDKDALITFLTSLEKKGESNAKK